jgi:hypothetical protein
MSLVKTFPRGPWWALALGLAVFFGGIVAAGLVWSPWPLAACVVGGVVFGEARGLRCPQCGRRLAERKTPVEGGPAYRLFLECRHCCELWDSGHVFDPSGP